MRNQILKFGEQFRIGEEAAKEFKIALEGLKPTLEEVVIAGIGGSAIPGKIVKTLYPWIQLREYGNTLYHNTKTVIAVSWSGNAIETLKSYKSALNENLKTIAITGGGQLAQLAEDNGQDLILLPHNNLRPRTAVGYMTAALFRVLPLGDNFDFDLEIIKLESQGKDLAQTIQNKIPIIYAPHSWGYAAEFWKTLFNENSKIHSIWNTFPILEHAELAGFNAKDKEKYFVIILRDSILDNSGYFLNDKASDSDIDHAIAILEKIGYNYSIVNLSGKTSLEKILNSYVLALWTSYYLADFLGVDPADTGAIEEFKKLKLSQV